MNPRPKICVVGLGYVGLPLLEAFSSKYDALGYDSNLRRIEQIRDGIDVTGEIKNTRRLKSLKVTNSEAELRGRNFFIITVPTPVDDAKRPDLTMIRSASETVGKHIQPGAVVVYESTVYPGLTEEVCIPILEQVSGLQLNEEFFCGYSPERINPGDAERGLTNIVKVTSGSNSSSAEYIDQIYNSVIAAGTYKASSIKVAEASKVIENTQRDINIAFINELALLFEKLEIDSREVLSAASTKWNWLPFNPGLVGGHCIGVDPFYLTEKAQKVGHQPEIILAGRRLNDEMPVHIANSIAKRMSATGLSLFGSEVLVIGYTFKPNCPDTRNTKVFDLCVELAGYGCQIYIFDPSVRGSELSLPDSLTFIEDLSGKTFDGIVYAVDHRIFSNLKIKDYRKEKSVVYDITGNLPKGTYDARL